MYPVIATPLMLVGAVHVRSISELETGFAERFVGGDNMIGEGSAYEY